MTASRRASAEALFLSRLFDGHTPTSVFHELASILVISVVSQIDQLTRCNCPRSIGRSPQYELPDVLLTEVPDTFATPAPECAELLKDHLRTRYHLGNNYIIAAFLLYQESPKHYLLLENAQGSYLRLADSLQGAVPLTTCDQLQGKFASAFILRKASITKDYPALTLQDQFYELWGKIV